MGNLVAIVGRPNVGKSTLFNRLTNSRQAIVSDEAGTTRDRQYGKCEWTGREFSVVDTGGWVVNSDDIFEEEIRKQVLIATEEADLVLFLCDIKNGVTDWDMDVAQILRKAKLPVLLVANKADDGKDLYGQYDFYKLGLGDPYCISAATGSGTGDLLDKVLELLPEKQKNDLEEGIPRFAVVGRPNAGKSSIINAFIGEERNIVTEIAGTTRDAIEDTINIEGITYRFIDTAGIRQTTDTIENLGIEKTFEKTSRAAIVIAMFDASDNAEKISASLREIEKKMADDADLIVVYNKTDIHHLNKSKISNSRISGQVSLSAKSGNIEELINLLTSNIRTKQQSADQVIVTNARHYNALLLAKEAMQRAIDKLNNNTETDLLAIDIHEIIDNLSSILGSKITPDEVLGNIFEHFCIGK